MKTIIGVLLLVFVMWVAVNNLSGTPLEYVKEETMEVVEQQKEAWMLDEEAIQAAKDVIRKKELQAELEALDLEIKEKQAKRKEVALELESY